MSWRSTWAHRLSRLSPFACRCLSWACQFDPGARLQACLGSVWALNGRPRPQRSTWWMPLEHNTHHNHTATLPYLTFTFMVCVPYPVPWLQLSSSVTALDNALRGNIITGIEHGSSETWFLLAIMQCKGCTQVQHNLRLHRHPILHRSCRGPDHSGGFGLIWTLIGGQS